MGAAFVDLAVAVWRSRRTTWLFVFAFVGWVGKGVVDGFAESVDIDASVRVRFHYVHTTQRDVWIAGRAALYSVRHDGVGALLVGPSELHVDCRDVGQAMLSMEFAWESARLGDSFRIEDTATNAVHVVDNLVVHHSGVMVPLPKAATVLRIVPSNPALGLRLHGVKLRPDLPLTAFAVDTQWEPIHADAVAAVALGAGFWPRSAGSPHLETQRCAYLRVDPVQPGPHVLELAFRRPDPLAPMPIVTLGEQRIWAAVDGSTVWSRATTADGCTVLELQVDLAKTNVLGIECAGEFRSAWERGWNGDLRRLAYTVEFERCRIRTSK